MKQRQVPTSVYFSLYWFVKNEPDLTDRGEKVTSLAADHMARGSGMQNASIFLQSFTSPPPTLRCISSIFFPSTMKRRSLTNVKQHFYSCICQVSTLQVCLAQGRIHCSSNAGKENRIKGATKQPPSTLTCSPEEPEQGKD